ncbi:extracellular solute-binding protein [Alkalicoccobacillus porphyridii]|uniref:Extracellular solute-binding protein n=1 Tax=Alkalicoccobacillus porphyridii TaxID=2597270 RepID=A0A553ZVZ9_9BACI|nr:extracellular solute-binding protein [Alkalicoccobacillus porphyridii]TSB45603.1 extracellular solute-binding protein [Alkalicoccobacillus porphyridii]
MNKKMVLTTTLAFMLLGACSNEADDQVTLDVWAIGWEAEQLVNEGYIQRFEDENPGVKVNLQAIPWDNIYDNLLTAVASGSGPDVVQLGTSYMADFASTGALLPLDEYVEEYPNLDPDHFFEGATDSALYNDELMAVPWYVETRVLFYRTDLLADVGYPDGPETWEELYEAAKKLYDRGHGLYGMTLPENDDTIPYIFAWQNGVEFETDNMGVDFSDPKFVESVEYYTRFFREDLAPLGLGLDPMQSFVDGIQPMFFEPPYRYQQLIDNYPDFDDWDTKMMPGKENNVSVIGGSNMAVFEWSEHPDESVAFLSYLTDRDTQIDYFNDVRVLPPRVDAWEDPALQEDERLYTYYEQLQYSRAQPQVLNWNRINDEWKRSEQRITRADYDIEEEIKDFRSRIEPMIVTDDE